MKMPPPVFPIQRGADESGRAFRARLSARLQAHMSYKHTGSLEDIRAQLSQFVYGAIPRGVHVEGLVVAGPVNVHTGWRRWAMRLGLWLVRKSGCEVVRPDPVSGED